MPISAVIITCNEAATIARCLEPLRQVADEILVLDSFSTDGTIEICQRLGAKIISQPWLGYAQTKNLGNARCLHDWVLSIDADEVLSDELVASLQRLQPENGIIYALDRLTNFCGQWIYHSGWYPEWKPRLFNRKEVAWQGDFVHETLRYPPDFQVVKLKGKLFHYSYKDDEDHLHRTEKYARLGAEDLFARGKKEHFFKKIFGPAARFFTAFILKSGFLDGRAGWKIAWRGAYLVRLRSRILKGLFGNQHR